MNNLLPVIKQEQGILSLENKAKLKEAIEQLVAPYKQAVVTEETQKEAKKQRAELNKMSKLIDDKRKEYKNEYLKPLNDFEDDMNEIKSIVNSAQLEIKSKLDEIEAKRVEEKTEEIKSYIDEYADGFEIMWNSQWTNKTYKTEHIIDDIKSQVTELKMEQERLERDRQSIVSVCAGHGISEVPYIAMFNNGTELSEVIQIINEQAQQVKQVEEPTLIEVKEVEQVAPINKADIEPVAFIEDDEVLERVIKVSGTREQLQQMNAYCLQIGVRIEKA